MFKVNPQSKSYRLKNAKARQNAWRAAELAITYGNGSLAEALEAYKFFNEGFPSLNKYIGRIEWLKVYRSHPQWRRLRPLQAHYSTSFGK